MNTGIYKIENVVNGHCYIGQSINIKQREYAHFSYLEKNKHHNIYLQRAYKKHGKENFVFIPLVYCESFELTRYEQKLVDIFSPEYNIHKECVNSPKGTKHTPEEIQKISLSSIGRKHTEETKKKISQILIGNTYASGNTNWLGKKHTEEYKRNMSLIKQNQSEETRKKNSQANTGKKLSNEHKQKISLAAKARWERERQRRLEVTS